MNLNETIIIEGFCDLCRKYGIPCDPGEVDRFNWTLFYIFKEMTTFSNALLLCAALVAIILMVMSRRLKRSSIRMERMFVQNLRSRDIAAQASGKRKPLFEGHLLDRDLHISEVIVPDDSLWAGKTLKQLQLNQRFGINVSSILRGSRRINIPSANDVIFPGDRLSVIGDDERLTMLDSTLQKEVHPEDYDIENREISSLTKPLWRVEYATNTTAWWSVLNLVKRA